jgi:hypothetical protein
MKFEEITLNEKKPGSGRHRSHVLFHMWKMDPKDKHIYKEKCF